MSDGSGRDGESVERHLSGIAAETADLARDLLETHAIDLPAVEQGYRAALEGERVNHEQSVERLRGVHRYALEVARRIARSESRCDWRITDPLLARYLAEFDPLL